MLEKILGALLPAVITILLGYFAARHHDFEQAEVPTLNKMVMSYALPLSLFVGVVSAGRAELLADLPLVAFLAAAFVGMYVVILLLGVFGLRQSPGLSALRALTAAAPSTAFVGTPVLGYLYGDKGDIPVAVGSIIIVVCLVPVTLILLSLDSQVQQAAKSGPGRAPAAAHGEPEGVDIMGKILSALKQPVVWLPFLGFILVILNFDVPKIFDDSLSLLGHAAAGVALFTAGIILAGYKIILNRQVAFLVVVKNVVQPGLVCAGMLWLGYGNPHLGEAVVTSALPPVTLVVMLAVQYRVAIPETASALLISTVGSLITISAFIWFLL
ncbi:MAG TPA: AEC family transporter [Methyloceanibacter sp.]|nr:AEC family transporter [Methyloceanibacter sp.]